MHIRYRVQLHDKGNIIIEHWSTDPQAAEAIHAWLTRNAKKGKVTLKPIPQHDVSNPHPESGLQGRITRLKKLKRNAEILGDRKAAITKEFQIQAAKALIEKGTP